MDFKKIEKKWRAKWAKAKIFEADVNPKKKKFFTSNIIPYVNGDIHIGHSFTYSRVDAYVRFKRMQGFNACLAQGFHATGEPILGTVERLRKGDKSQIETFKMYGATEKDIKQFEKYGAEEVAKFWTRRIIGTMKLMGFSVDWRRKFITALDSSFNRFIEWQYNTLRKKGYVIQGTHPVIWCPHDQSPTGDHDRLKGEGESPIEFTILKFKFKDMYICAATLRPETVFGQTNMWANPDVEYAIALVNNKEKWIISKECVKKLKDQLKKIEIIGSIEGKELIGKYCKAPVINKDIIILPATFCDPKVGTGLVTSVPSHAPFDWQALVDLKSSPNELKKYGINPEVLKELEPISIIKVEGFGEHPAEEIIGKMEIKSQEDQEKLKKALHEIYTKEHHTGVMKENCGEYSSKPVGIVKEEIKQKMIKDGSADVIWEPTEEVICRCTNRCHVKILENQWFLKFSDKAWKEKVKQVIAQMKFYPEEARIQFLNTVDWLDDKACARKSGLGTRLPWDKEWIVETLSDSVIYMAYYTIARTINENKIFAEKLTDEVFDYVFLGKGNLKELSKKSKLNEKLIQGMREEFEYFYPLDLRNSAKELVQNHLTYALFHHVAIWDNPKYWPKAYGINGFVTVLGEKMAKSKGNIIPLKDLIEQYGADLVRINITTSNENMDDADWKEDSLKTFSSRLTALKQFVKEYKKGKRKSVNNLDKYMETILQNCVKGATENYEVMKFRSGIQYVAFQLLNELHYYIERCGGIKNCNKNILKECVSTILRLIAPFTPHISEELWTKLGNKNFVSLGPWPTFDEKKIDKNILELENIFKKTQEDLNQVLKLAGNRKNAYLYFVTDKELDYFKESLHYLENLFNFKKIELYKVSDKSKYDPEGKAERSKYSKPAIYLE